MKFQQNDREKKDLCVIFSDYFVSNLYGEATIFVKARLTND